MNEIQIYTYDQVYHIQQHILFDTLNDDEKSKEWNPLFVQNIYHDKSRKICEGMTYQTVLQYGKKRIVTNNEILEFNEPSDIRIKGESKEGTTLMAYRLRSTGQETRLHIEINQIPKNWYYKLLIKLFRFSFKPFYDEQFDRLYNYIHYGETISKDKRTLSTLEK